MVASSNDIRTNSDTSSIYEQRGWKRSDPIPPHIYDIHRSLVEEGIITNPPIINCSKQFIRKLEPDIPNPDKPRRIKRCHYVNHCPICNLQNCLRFPLECWDFWCHFVPFLATSCHFAYCKENICVLLLTTRRKFQYRPCLRMLRSALIEGLEGV